MNNIFFKTLFKKGAKGAKGEKGTSYEVPTNGIIGFDDEDGELDIPAGYDDATIPPYLIRKVIKTNGSYSAADAGAFGFSEVDVEIKNTPTLVSKTITENGTYDPADDNADGYLNVNVNVSGGGGGSVDGLYFDGAQNSKIRVTAFDTNKDIEIEMKFWLPSYQGLKAVLGNTASGYEPCCFMNNDKFTIGTGNGQIYITPTNGFIGEHTLIINRLSDKAIVLDNEVVGTYGAMSFGQAPALDLGKGELNGVTTAEFVFKYLKITDRTTGEVISDYEAGFRDLNPYYKIPCLLNTIDNSYIDLNKGRTDTYDNNNAGHIMVCQEREG